MPSLLVTYFRFDTCGCCFHIDYRGLAPAHISYASVLALQQARWALGDTSAKQEPPLLTILCPAHAALGDTTALLTTVEDENQRKNYLLTEVLEADGIPAAQQNNLRAKAAQAERLRVPVGSLLNAQELANYVRMRMIVDSYQWSFDAARVLRAQFPNLDPPFTPGQKIAIQARANARFGPGKVVL